MCILIKKSTTSTYVRPKKFENSNARNDRFNINEYWEKREWNREIFSESVNEICIF